MEINLNHESVVNERTGVVEAPSEYVANLRKIEEQIQQYDDAIGVLKADLKVARESREKSVTLLREAVREGKVLPLLETEDDNDESDTPTN